MTARAKPRPFVAALTAAGVAAAAAFPAWGRPPALERPVFTVGADHALVVSALPDVLSNAEVRPRLTSGLTTSLVLRATAADAKGRRVEGGAVVEVRYEPWDEVFLVSALGSDGLRRRESLPSLDRLVAWWRGLKVPLLAAGDRQAAGTWRIKLALDVIPFSRAEQSETQSWLSQSLAEQADNAQRTAAGAAPPASSVVAGPAAGVLELLVATSIKRHTLISFEWTGVARAGPAGGAGGDREPRP